MSWDKAKDILIISLLGIAVRVFSSNMDELNKSVQDLNLKVGLVIQESSQNKEDIKVLKEDVRELERRQSRR